METSVATRHMEMNNVINIIKLQTEKVISHSRSSRLRKRRGEHWSREIIIVSRTVYGLRIIYGQMRNSEHRTSRSSVSHSVSPRFSDLVLRRPYYGPDNIVLKT